MAEFSSDIPPLSSDTPPPDRDSDIPPPDRGGGVLSGLLAPLRLPERVAEAIESIAEKLEDVRPMREDVATIREQSADLDGLLPALDTMKEDIGGRLDALHECMTHLEEIEGNLDQRVGDLCGEITAMKRTVEALQDDVKSVTDRLPDPNRGPIEKARDVLTGGD